MPAPLTAVVGCGHWGKNLVRVFHELGALAGVNDADPETTRVAAQTYGVTAFESFDDVLADPAVVAVAIAAPASQHASLARRALLADKDAFVEKPLALDVSEAEELCALAQERGRVLMVGHLLQYHPVFLRLKTLVDQGELGRIDYLYSNRLNLGKFRREENILWSFAPHDISMILGLVGAEPSGVSAVGCSYLNQAVADVTTTHLSFATGQNAHVFVSWLHPYKEQKLVVVGTAGMAVFDDGEPWEAKLRLYRHRIDWREGLPLPVKADAELVDVEHSEPLHNECAHFLDCVQSRALPRTDGAEGLRVLRVLAAASESMLVTPAATANTVSPAVAVRARVHETAVVDDDVEIGAGTSVWHFSHLLAGTRIGRNCSLGQNVVVGPDVHVGDGCRIQNNVSLYKGVRLEEDVFCGPSCVFTNVLNPRAEVSRKDEFRETLVRRGASIGANATIVCGTTLGEYSFVGAGAVVTRDVPAFALVVGSPARRIGWMSHAGERLGDDLVCPRTGRRYRTTGRDRLEEIPTT